MAGESSGRCPWKKNTLRVLNPKSLILRGTRGGGSITAALFLKQFVKETPWAHLDIAGQFD